jgi:predicted house-cleaning noncanonical NTP pyrophosphatase (MazG superfamily)
MCQHPLVIRCDIAQAVEQDETLLQTSLPLTDATAAAHFMDRVAAAFAAKSIRNDQWAFLLAHLVPARASAMIHAHPKAERVRIDALWGYPDGLLHLPHDSWFYYPQANRTVRRLRYKGVCLLPTPQGWQESQVGPPFDWTSVLSKSEVTTIGQWAIRLADELGEEIQLMALARIGGMRGGGACLPWHYTMWSVPQYSESLRILPNLSHLEVITCPADIVRLAKSEATQSKRGYLIRPVLSLLRDYDFLTASATFAVQQHKPLYFEGSVLGHAYYIMAKTGAVVIPVTDDEPETEPKTYNKLVRDNIPFIIKRAGGLARVRKVPRSDAAVLLSQKLIEEAFEVWNCDESARAEELVDVLDVVEALRKHTGIELDDLERTRGEKRRKRGGFDELIFLEQTGIESLRAGADNEGYLPLFNDEDAIASPVSHREEPLRVEIASRSSELIKFSIPLIPPIPRRPYDKALEATIGSFKIEAKYSGTELLVSVTTAPQLESPDQLNFNSKLGIS